tara:strand:+ start:210 stop:419 length:210 start_codon:yes stop_codon:yes gene_type:complete
MAKIQKFIEEKTWLWYQAEITDEQAAEWKVYENDETGEIEEPEWVDDLDFDLVRDKPASDDTEFELIED